MTNGTNKTPPHVDVFHPSPFKNVKENLTQILQLFQVLLRIKGEDFMKPLRSPYPSPWTLTPIHISSKPHFLRQPTPVPHVLAHGCMGTMLSLSLLFPLAEKKKKKQQKLLHIFSDFLFLNCAYLSCIYPMWHVNYFHL